MGVETWHIRARKINLGPEKDPHEQLILKVYSSIDVYSSMDVNL